MPGAEPSDSSSDRRVAGVSPKKRIDDARKGIGFVSDLYYITRRALEGRAIVEIKRDSQTFTHLSVGQKIEIIQTRAKHDVINRINIHEIS